MDENNPGQLEMDKGIFLYKNTEDTVNSEWLKTVLLKDCP